jgi:murein DD-endopeptidase MepM/ murein hydrolase activator NlpD
MVTSTADKETQRAELTSPAISSRGIVTGLPRRRALPSIDLRTRRVVISRHASSSSSRARFELHGAAPRLVTQATLIPATSSRASSSIAATEFPPFDHAVFPVSQTPNWGAMYTPLVWNRTYAQMADEDFVRVPSYDPATFTVPFKSLVAQRSKQIPAITAKLFYSTRFYGRYDLDAGEFTGDHVGVDLKLAHGTPIGAIGGGRVSWVGQSQRLGLFVVLEHRVDDSTYYSVYGHFDDVAVRDGEDVQAGQVIGWVGMTGNTSAPHLHLQIDRNEPGVRHEPYAGAYDPTRTVHPIAFIAQHARRERAVSTALPTP